MADETVTEVVKVNPFAADAKVENEKRGNAKGLRVFTGFTRGKGSNPIKWEQFDDSKPESMPKSIQEFLDVTKATEPQMLDYLIEGFNSSQYTAASDPIAEHVNPEWDDETQSQFRLVVRNLQKAMAASGATIESVVAMVKPGVEIAYKAKAAANKS